MKNIHILPINLDSVFQQSNGYIINQNVYITSNEKLPYDDSIFATGAFYHRDAAGDVHIINKDTHYPNPNFCSRIILTTDESLFKDGVQAIDDEFLEWFVKNPSCESVETVQVCIIGCDKLILNGENSICCGDKKYKIIIPQEEPKQDSVFENAKLVLREHLLENKEQVAKDLQEMKEKSSTNRDETLEEAAEFWDAKQTILEFTKSTNRPFAKAFIEGANWQQEKSYSEKEVFEIVATILHTPTLRDGSWEDISKWFEKNKKK